MKKIGVISDTHGNTPLMFAAAEILFNNSASEIWHLGDSYADAMALQAEAPVPVTPVPGLYCPEYGDGSAPKKFILPVEGLRIALAHAPGEFTAEDLAAADVIINGHTHKYSVVEENGKIFINPGHLKNEADRQRPPTFALIEIANRDITVSIFGTDGAILQKNSFQTAGSRK
jgi:hypothetical protein